MANNRDLPTYEPQVKLEVQGAVDTQSPAQSLINAFSQFAGAINTAEVMVTKYEVEGQRADIRNQIAKSYADYSMTAMQNDNKTAALQGYNQQSDQYAKEYLEQTHIWNRGYAKNMLDYFANVHRAPIIGAVNQQTNRIAAMESALTQQDMTSQVLDAINNSKPQIDPETGENLQFRQADALAADQYKKLTQDYINGHTRQEVVRTTIPNLNKEYTKAKAIKGYADALENDQGYEYLRDFQNAPIPGLTDAEKNSLANGAFAQARAQHFTKLGITLHALDTQFNDMLKTVEAGGVPNTLLMDAMHQSKPLPDYVDAEKKLAIAQATADASKRFAMMNPLQAENQVEQYRPTNPKDPNYKYQELMYNKIKAAANKTFKALYNDPMVEARKDPTIQKVFADYKVAQEAGATGTNLPNSPFNTQSLHPDYALSYYQERRGLNLGGSKNTAVRFMSDAEAKSMVSTINMSDPRQKLQIFNQLKNQSANGSFYNARIKQLVDAGMNPQYATFANIDPTSPFAQHYATALSMPLGGLTSQMKQAHPDLLKRFDSAAIADVYKSSAPGLFRTAGRNNFSGYMASLSAYSGGRSSQFNEQMLSSIKNLGYYAMMNGLANNENDALVWAENAIADKYTTTMMNGQQIRVPKQYTPETIKAYANSMQEKVADFPFVTSGATPDLPSAPRASDVDREIIQKGHWANDPLDHGLVWVDMNGKLRTDRNGKPLAISFDEAQNWQAPAAPLFHHEDRIFNALMNKPQVDDAKVVKEKISQFDQPEKAPSGVGLVKDIMNNNIPAFKEVDFEDIDHREPNVYNATARGLRNNNPGNIKKTSDRWAGEISGEDRVFKTFKTPEAGIKAMSSLLVKYANRGIDTVNAMVRRWSSTDQNQYVAYVSRKLGVNPNEKINLRDKETRGQIMNALIEYENGSNPYGENIVVRNA